MNGYSIQRLSTNKQVPHNAELHQFSKADFPPKPTAHPDTTSLAQVTETKIPDNVFITPAIVDTLTNPIDTVVNKYTVPFSPKKLFKKSSKNAAVGLGIAAMGSGTTAIMTFSLEEFFAILSILNIVFIALGVLLLGLWIYALITKISLRKKTIAKEKEGENSKVYTHQSSSINFPRLDLVSVGLLYTLFLMIIASVLTLLFIFLSPDGLSFPQKMIAILGCSGIIIQLVLIVFCAYKIWKLTQATKNSRIDR